jgi:hypothetical protein
MALFGSNLAEVDSRLFENLKKTKAVFPEETQRIEWGLDLMRNLTQITKEASKDYPTRPNLYANHNLFARNRQLLVNAYVCLLFSSYGTQFVILRTVLENNNLMRLFNKNPKYAFEWLPINRQKRFTKETQLKYGKSGKHDETFDPFPVTNLLYDTMGKAKVKKDINKFYGQLCNYTHPNFVGWQELMGEKGEGEFILNIPSFSTTNSETGIGVTLFLMQVSFKSFVETFKGYLARFAYQLEEWQDNFNRLIPRFQDSEKT